MKSLLFTVSLLLAAQLSYTQSPAQPYFSAIIVSNLDSAMAWYTQVFKLDTLSQLDLPERGIRIANLQGERMLLELIEFEQLLTPTGVLSEAPKGTRLSGWFKYGFAVPDFDEWMEHLKAQEVTFYGEVVTDPNLDKRMIIVLDPEGNRLQFFEE